MEKPANENCWEEDGIKLFKHLEDKAKSLEEEKFIFNESIQLINEGKFAHNQKNYSDSLMKYNQARDKIAKATISIKFEPVARNLLIIELAYLFVLLLLGWTIHRWPDYIAWKGLINQSLQTTWFGALGGITIGIFGIYTHVQQKDFDPKYRLWYICKPLVGAIFGWFVYLIYLIVIVATVGTNAENDNSAIIKFPQLPFILAFLAGFSERFTIKMIDKLMSVLITWDGKSTESK